MRHHVTIKKFGREKNQRNALIRSLAESLILRGKIKTTEAKAKAVRPSIERLVTIAKKGGLASSRALMAHLGPGIVSQKLISDVAPRYKDRNGGYTRIVKVPARTGDAAKMAIIEFV